MAVSLNFGSQANIGVCPLLYFSLAFGSKQKFSDNFSSNKGTLIMDIIVISFWTCILHLAFLIVIRASQLS